LRFPPEPQGQGRLRPEGAGAEGAGAGAELGAAGANDARASALKHLQAERASAAPPGVNAKREGGRPAARIEVQNDLSARQG